MELKIRLIIGLEETPLALHGAYLGSSKLKEEVKCWELRVNAIGQVLFFDFLC
jgi:hypothetical protein